MRAWLSALWSETVFRVWGVLSALSTLATFFFPAWSGKPRLISVVSAILGFAWANLRVFQKQQKTIEQLRSELAAKEARRADLVIAQESGSRFIPLISGDVRHADFVGILLEFRLMIENRGTRNSIVSAYTIEIEDLQQTYADLRPVEGQGGANGRHSHLSFNPASILSKTGNILIPAETATDRGTLLFFIPGITLQSFVDAGLQMQGEQRRFGTIRCRLTLTDTTGASAVEWFELHEA